jgi:hypothetical protein
LKKTGSRPINTDLLPESSNPQNKKINFSVFNKGCTRGVNSNGRGVLVKNFWKMRVSQYEKCDII